MPDPVACGSPRCQAKIIFVTVANNLGHKPRQMPLNAEPDPTGNVAVMVTGTGALTGYILRTGQKAVPPEVTYMPHFATCTDPAWYRRKRDKGRTAVQSGGRVKRAAPTPSLFDT
jgi:hypothetical protein